MKTIIMILITLSVLALLFVLVLLSFKLTTQHPPFFITPKTNILTRQNEKENNLNCTDTLKRNKDDLTISLEHVDINIAFYSILITVIFTVSFIGVSVVLFWVQSNQYSSLEKRQEKFETDIKEKIKANVNEIAEKSINDLFEGPYQKK